MANVARTIIGSFEDIGKDVVKQTARVPVDIAGKALESLGSSSGQKKPGQSGPAAAVSSGEPKDQWDKFDQAKGDGSKQKIAREALAALTQRGRSKDLPVRVKLEQEEAQKKQLEQEKVKAAAAQVLPHIGSKRPAGDLYGIKAKQNAAEVSRNVRSD